MTERYVRINSDGSSEYVITERSPRLITEAMARQFAGDVTIPMRNVFETTIKGFPPFLTHMAASNTKRMLVTQLPFLRLNCHFELASDGFLVPKFFHRDEPAKEKFVKSSLNWTPPLDMIIMFAAPIMGFNDRGSESMTTSATKPYLIAYNPDKQAWVLPLPNLYEDCSACLGKYSGASDSYQKSFELCLQQFLLSDWNTDLIDENKINYCRHLFKFNPLETDTHQLRWDHDAMRQARSWQMLCRKAGTPVTISVGGFV